MKEIVDRLQENRQLELAKSILENRGYTVSKRKLRESYISDRDLAKLLYSIYSLVSNYGGIERFKVDREGSDEIDDPCTLLHGNYSNIYMVCDEDEGSEFKEFRALLGDMDEIRTIRKSYGTSTLCHSDNLDRDVVYQNIAGMITYYVKLS